MTEIRNPVQWGIDGFNGSVTAVGATRRLLSRPKDEFDLAEPEIRRIGFADLKTALREGFEDFAACRTDVLFIALIYPLAGFALYRLTVHLDMLPLLFPITAGFALLGPILALGLYEMSRLRERGEDASWGHAFDVVRSPSAGAIVALGSLLVAIFVVWLLAAMAIYELTMGKLPPISAAQFARDVFGTSGGLHLIVLGCGVGFLFAVGVLAISVVSFPLLLDRKVRVRTAIATSVRAVTANPGPMFAWGLIVAAGLALGAAPALLGLIVVMPVLGHATWRLYRKVVI